MRVAFVEEDGGDGGANGGDGVGGASWRVSAVKRVEHLDDMLNDIDRMHSFTHECTRSFPIEPMIQTSSDVDVDYH